MAIGKWKIETWQLTDLGVRNHGKRILAVVFSPEKLSEIEEVDDSHASEFLSKESRKIRFGVNWSDYDKLYRSQPVQYADTEWEAAVIAGAINGEKAPLPRSSKKYEEAMTESPSLRLQDEEWGVCLVFRKKSALTREKRKIILRIMSPYELNRTHELIQDDVRSSKSLEVRTFLFPKSHDEIARIDWFGPRQFAKSYDSAVTIARNWKKTLRSQSRPANIFGPNKERRESEIDGSESPALETNIAPRGSHESSEKPDSLRSPERAFPPVSNAESQLSPNSKVANRKSTSGKPPIGRELSIKAKQAVLLEWASILKRRMG